MMVRIPAGFKKTLLTCTALVAVSAFSAQANAAALTLGANGTWASAGGQTSIPTTDVTNATAGDTVSITAAATTLTVTNSGANDGNGVNKFVLGAVTNTNAGTLLLVQTGANVAALNVTIAAATLGSNVTFNVANTASAALTAAVTGALSVGGNLIVTNNQATTAAMANAVTVGSISAVTGLTTVSAGSLAGGGTTSSLTVTGNSSFTGAVTVTGGGGAASNTATLALNGTTNTFTGGLTLTNGASGAALLTFGGTGAQSVTGAVAGNGTVTINQTAGAVTFNNNVAATTFNFAANGTASMATGANLTAAITTSTTDTGTLTLAGATAVAGQVGTGGNLLHQVNAGAGISSFSTDVYATKFVINGASTVTMSGNYTGTTLDFAGQGGTVSLASGKIITAAVDSTGSSNGTLTLAGGVQSVSGIVGGTNALAVINAGATGGTSTFTSTVNAAAINVTGTGTIAFSDSVTGAISFGANDGIVTLASGKNLTGTVNATGANKGTLTLSGGAQTVSGAVGATQAIKIINAAATNGQITKFLSTVNAQTINLTGTGTIAFSDSVTGAISFGANDGFVTLASGKNITGTVDASALNTGTLTLSGGAQTVSGTVGATQPLKVINAGAAGAVSTFSAAVKAQTINVTGSGTIAFSDNATGAISFGGNDGVVTFASGKGLTGTVDTTLVDTGTLTLSGGVQGISAAVGATQSLKIINAGATGAISTFSSTVKAKTINLMGTGTVVFAGDVTGAVSFGANDGVVTLNSGVSITGTVDTTTANTGTLTLSGGVQGISGVVGGTQALKVINAGAIGATSTFSNTVKAQAINVTGTGTVAFLDSVTGAIDFNANAGTVTLASGKNITGTVNSTGGVAGTLSLLGGAQTVSGVVGASSSLTAINVGAAGGAAIFSAAVNALTVNVTGTGTATFNGILTGNVAFGGNDGVVVMGTGVGITGAVDTSGANTGTLTLSGGTQTVTGAVGATQALKIVNAGATGGVSNFTGAVKTQTLNVTGTGTVNLNAGLTGNVAFTVNDGVVVLASGQGIAGSVDATSANRGTLTLSGGVQVVSGTVGATQPLKVLNVAATGGTSNFSGAVKAQTINVTGTGIANFSNNVTGAIAFGGNNGTVTLASGKSLTGTVDTTLLNTGTLTLLGGAQTVSSTVGATQAINIINAGVAGATATFADVVNAQTVNVTGTGTLNFSQNLTGAVTFAGDGVVALASGKNLTGAVDAGFVNTGTLTLSGGTQSVSGTVGATQPLKIINAGTAAGAATTFQNTVSAQTINISNATGTATFNGNVTGGLNLTGAAVIAAGKTLTGAVTGVPATGSLTFNGSSSGISSITALKALTLGGTGNTVTVGGGDVAGATTTTIAGNTLSITNGNFTLASGQQLNATITSKSAIGQVVATAGTATVDPAATIGLTIGTTDYIPDGTQFKIIDGGAGGSIGVLPAAQVTGANGKILSFSQFADANDLIIKATRVSISTLPLSVNELAAGAALDAMGAASTNEAALVQKNIAAATTDAQIAAILDTLLPPIDGGLQMGLLQANEQVMGLTESRMRALRFGFAYEELDAKNDSENMNDAPGYENDYGNYFPGSTGKGSLLRGSSSGSHADPISVWFQGYGQRAKRSAVGGINGYTLGTWGVVLGVDMTEVISGGSLGVAVHYGNVNIDAKNTNATGTKVNGSGATAYGTFDLPKEFFLIGQVGYTYNNVIVERNNVGGIGLRAHGDFAAHQFSGRMALGRDYGLGSYFLLTPSVSTAYTYLQTMNYMEKRAGNIGLQVDGRGEGAFRTAANLEFSAELEDSEGALLRPSMHGGYTYDSARSATREVTSFVAGGPKFVSSGGVPAPGTFNMGASMTYMTPANWALSGNYDYQVNSEYTANSATLRSTLRF